MILKLSDITDFIYSNELSQLKQYINIHIDS